MLFLLNQVQSILNNYYAGLHYGNISIMVKINFKSIFEFFINYEKTALQIFFFTLQGCSLVVTGEADKILGMVVWVSFP